MVSMDLKALMTNLSLSSELPRGKDREAKEPAERVWGTAAVQTAFAGEQIWIIIGRSKQKIELSIWRELSYLDPMNFIKILHALYICLNNQQIVWFLDYIHDFQEFIDRWRYNAKRASQAQMRIKILEKLWECFFFQLFSE